MVWISKSAPVDFELLAQAGDVGLDGVGADGLFHAVDAVFERALGNHAAAAAQQQFEQGEFAARQQDRLSRDLDGAVHGVEAEIAGLEPEAEGAARPPQQRLQAGDQLLHGEGLLQVVVGAAVEALDAMGDAVARGQDQDRRGIAALAQGLEDLQAVTVGQRQVENAGVVARGAEGGERLVDQGHAVDDEAGVLQPLGGEVGQAIIVFDEEHAHRRFRPGIATGPSAYGAMVNN